MTFSETARGQSTISPALQAAFDRMDAFREEEKRNAYKPGWIDARLQAVIDRNKSTYNPVSALDGAFVFFNELDTSSHFTRKAAECLVEGRRNDHSLRTYYKTSKPCFDWLNKAAIYRREAARLKALGL